MSLYFSYLCFRTRVAWSDCEPILKAFPNLKELHLRCGRKALTTSCRVGLSRQEETLQRRLTSRQELIRTNLGLLSPPAPPTSTSPPTPSKPLPCIDFRSRSHLQKKKRKKCFLFVKKLKHFPRSTILEKASLLSNTCCSSDLRCKVFSRSLRARTPGGQTSLKRSCGLTLPPDGLKCPGALHRWCS